MERDASPPPPVKESCCNYRMLPAAAYVNPEVKGFISADPGKTIWFMSFAFLVLAVLQVAYASAGTECMCLSRGLRDGVEGCGELPEHDDPEEDHLPLRQALPRQLPELPLYREFPW